MAKAAKINSTAGSLLVAAAAAGAIALSVEHWRNSQQAARQSLIGNTSATAQVVTEAVAKSSPAVAKAGNWSASAPGRIEPRGGEVRIGAQMPGKVAQVLVQMNDSVKAGDLLVRLVDDEPLVKLAAATAEADVRRRERDVEQAAETPPVRRPTPQRETDPPLKMAADRRAAEDASFTADRAAYRARMELDRLQSAAARGAGLAADIATARTALAEASEKAEQERVGLRRLQALPGMPLPTRLEASLAVARAELASIETAIERTRVRAPADGTVLLVNSNAGETVSPSPEDVLLMFGDLTQLRVRAEIEERDVGKVRAGQAVVVRSDAFPGQDFAGRVERIANALGAPRIAAKGPRRAATAEQDVLQVLVELEGRPALVPGMRVDVFFKPDATVDAPADTQRN